MFAMFVLIPDASAGIAFATRRTDGNFWPSRAAHGRLLRHPPNALRKRVVSKPWLSLACQQLDSVVHIPNHPRDR